MQDASIPRVSYQLIQTQRLKFTNSEKKNIKFVLSWTATITFIIRTVTISKSKSLKSHPGKEKGKAARKKQTNEQTKKNRKNIIQ